MSANKEKKHVEQSSLEEQSPLFEVIQEITKVLNRLSLGWATRLAEYMYGPIDEKLNEKARKKWFLAKKRKVWNIAHGNVVDEEQRRLFIFNAEKLKSELEEEQRKATQAALRMLGKSK